MTGGREVSFRFAESSGGAALANTKLFDCTLLGKTKCSVEQIRRIGSELAADFGAYSFLWNNCRRFARLLARSIVRWDKSRDELKDIQRQSLSLFSTSDVVTLTLRDLERYDRLLQSVSSDIRIDAFAPIHLLLVRGIGGILGPLSPIAWCEVYWIRLLGSTLCKSSNLPQAMACLLTQTCFSALRGASTYRVQCVLLWFRM